MEKSAKVVIAEKPSSLRKHKNLFPLLVLFLIISVLGLIFLYSNGQISPKKPQAKKDSTIQNTQKTNGPIFGFWGTIEKINSSSDLQANIIVKADSGKKIELKIGEGITIKPFVKEVSQSSEPPRRMSPKNLEKGKRVYISSFYEIQIKSSMSKDDFSTIEVIN